MNRVDLVPETILASCVLHNICLDGLDNDIEDYILNNEINEIDNNEENNNEELNAQDMEGINKRNYIAQTLNMLD